MSREVILRPVPVESPVHRLRPETKAVTLVALSLALGFHPEWWLIAVAIGLTVLVFLLARLPRKVIPRPPQIMLMAIGFSALFTGIGGGEPEVGGIGIGGLLDLARLLSIGLTLLFWAAILAWTTGLAELGGGLVRMVQPLRRVGVPAEELGTVLTLTVRAIPLIGNELKVTLDAWSNRPQEEIKSRFGLGPIAELVDVGATAVANSYRRSSELAGAIVARGGVQAPVPRPKRWRPTDIAVMVFAIGISITSFIVL